MKTTIARTRLALIAAAKLVLAGSTIAAAAALFLVLSPDGQVQPSRADLFDLELFAPHTNTEKFIASLREMEHEPPRVYDHNGNTIFFSVGVSSKRPRELALDYLDAFERNDLQGEGKGRAESPTGLYTGELQLLYEDGDRAVLASSLLRDNWDEAARFDHETGQLVVDYSKLFDAFRYIEINWDEASGRSTTTASWSESGFDITKTFPEGLRDPMQPGPYDDEVPACIGCERLTRFEAQANDKPYVKQVFSTPMPPEQIHDFYQGAMRARGFIQSQTPERLAQLLADDPELEGHRLALYTKGRREVMVTVHIDEESGDTLVSTIAMSDEDPS